MKAEGYLRHSDKACELRQPMLWWIIVGRAPSRAFFSLLVAAVLLNCTGEVECRRARVTCLQVDLVDLRSAAFRCGTPPTALFVDVLCLRTPKIAHKPW
jgi:hypothetical protein